METVCQTRIKHIATALALVFTALTGGSILLSGHEDQLLLTLTTFLLVLLPMALEKYFHCRVRLSIYLLALFYALGPLLGHCWYFYYILTGWDKLLHTLAGVMFVFVGTFFYDLLAGDSARASMRILFGVLFSIAVAAVWEFFEFGMDIFFGMDMQNDTVISGFTSYLLGDSMAVTGALRDITALTVNGIPIPVDGYIDIGLIDTMLDMLLETLGAAVTGLALWFDKGRHPIIVSSRPEEEKIQDSCLTSS